MAEALLDEAAGAVGTVKVENPLAPDVTPEPVPYDYIPAGCDAAKALASRSTITRLVGNGRVRAVHVGPNLSVCATDLRDYVNERKNGVRIADVYEDLVQRAASFAPAMTPEQRRDLVAILSD